MITAILKGGLGNQLFQISAVINLAIENKESFGLDSRTWGDRGHAAEVFQANPPTSYLETIYKRIPFVNLSNHQFSHIYHEPHFHYKEIEHRPNMIIDGYFQSEKYFKKNGDTIRKTFYPSHIKKDAFLKKYGVSDSPVVGVHVRRASCLKDSNTQPPCSVEYYADAMKKFAQTENAVFLFISDEIEWCKENFKGHLYSKNDTDIEDFYDLIMCDHNIIANSTFSWWAAWLNKSPDKKVYFPKTWFGPIYGSYDLKDLIPEGWEKV